MAREVARRVVRRVERVEMEVAVKTEGEAAEAAVVVPAAAVVELVAPWAVQLVREGSVLSGRLTTDQTLCILEVAVKTEGETLEAAVVVPAATVEELVAPWAVKAAVGRARCFRAAWRCLLLGTNVALGAGDGANRPPRSACLPAEVAALKHLFRGST